MRRLALAASFALFSLGSIATANAQARSCGQGNQLVGSVVGALVGGTAGGLITNDRRSSSFRRRSSFRSGRGFGRRGFQRNNNGLGIAVGALAGGLIGNQIAGARTRNCVQQLQRSNNAAPFSSSRQQRTDAGPFGGQQPYQTQPTRTSAPTSLPPPLQTPAPSPSPATPSRVFQPICQFVTQTTELPNGQQSSEQVEVCQFSPNGEWIPR